VEFGVPKRSCDYIAQARAASGTNILLGIWLIASPWVYTLSERTSAVCVVCLGAVVSLFAALRLAALRESVGLSGVNFVLGFLAAASPWACGYAGHWGATINNLLLGVLIAILAIWSGTATLVQEKGAANHSPKPTNAG
jgi:SPW repeat